MNKNKNKNSSNNNKHNHHSVSLLVHAPFRDFEPNIVFLKFLLCLMPVEAIALDTLRYEHCSYKAKNVGWFVIAHFKNGSLYTRLSFHFFKFKIVLTLLPPSSADISSPATRTA